MFTGIITEIGKIRSIQRSRASKMKIHAPGLTAQLQTGQSVAVSGVCLTVSRTSRDEFEVNLSEETLKRTNFAQAIASKPVNLELAMPSNGRFDGHIVQGHVDMQGQVTGIPHQPAYRLDIHPLSDPGPLLVLKGSIAIDGVSLTISDLSVDGSFSVSLIPLTLQKTTLGLLRTGDRVNLEFDIIGKYVARVLKFC